MDTVVIATLSVLSLIWLFTLKVVLDSLRAANRYVEPVRRKAQAAPNANAPAAVALPVEEPAQESPQDRKRTAAGIPVWTIN